MSQGPPGGRPPAELVINPPRLVTLSAQNVDATGSDNLFSLLAARFLVLLKDFLEVLAVHIRRFLQLFPYFF